MASLMALLAVASCAPSQLKNLGKVEDFTLQDVNGNVVQWKDFRGKPVLAFFGYTYCPDFCPMTLHKLQKAFDASDEKENWPELLFLSVDPEHDSPNDLRKYLSEFTYPALALTGTDPELRIAAKQFGVTFYPSPENPRIIQHSPVLFLIDSSGNIRYLFKFDQTADELVAVVEELIEDS